MSPHPTRRDFAFLAGASLAAPAVASSTTRTPPLPSLPRENKKALKLGMVRVEGSLADKFAIVKRLGFDGIELDSPNDFETREVLDAIQTSGLPVHGVVDSAHWSKTLGDPDPDVRAEGRAALSTALRDAKAYGASSVLLVPAVVRKDIPYWDAWTRSQAEIRQVLPLAEELGIEILIENVWNKFLLGPTEIARYIDELASPLVGSYFDAGNLVTFGWPEHWVPILGHRIRKVDVKDFARSEGGFGVALNEGDADWPAIVAALRRIGYTGWFTAEVRGGDEDHLADIAARMDTFLPS